MKNRTTDFLILTILSLLTLFVNNDVIPADYMESRNLATAQEMVRHSNYLVPTMNGELRLEKPPLPTWIAAGVEHILPDSLSAQRAVTGFMGMLLVFFIYLLVKELTKNRKLGLYAAIVLATSYSIMMMARNATWDIYCHSFMLIAIYLLTKGLNKKGAQFPLLIGSSIFMGLSFLSKGPVSFYALLLPYLIAYGFIYRPSIKEKRGSIALMIILTLLISSWWMVFMYLFHKEEFLSVMHKESGSWINHNVRPWHYYILFFAESGIWALTWIFSLIYAYRQRKVLKSNQPALLLFFAWTLLSLLLLSFMPEKKTRYLLPLLIPGAINIASYWNYLVTEKLHLRIDRIFFKANNYLLGAIFLVLPLGLYLFLYKESKISTILLFVISTLFLTLALALIQSTRKKMANKAFLTLATSMIIVSTLCFYPIKSIFVNDDRHSIRELRAIKELKQYKFYAPANEFIRMELVYEANRTITPLDLKDSIEVSSRIPFVLVSTAKPDTLLQRHQLQTIGIYDNNWRPTDHKRYNNELLKYVTIVK